MKFFVVITTLIFLTISDAKAIFCDPSLIDPVDVGTLSMPNNSKEDLSSTKLGNDDCVDLPPITVTGYYPSFGSNYFSVIIWALGGTTIPAGSLVAVDGSNVPLTNRYGCEKSTKSDRETRSKRMFERQWRYSAAIIFDAGPNAPGYADASQWMNNYAYNGSSWSRNWPDGSVSTFTVQLVSDIEAQLTETSCE